MKTAAICLLLSVLIFVPAAFADSITSVAPSAFTQGEIEQFIEIQGTGLFGNIESQVILSGPAGTVTVEASPGDDAGTILFVSVPDFILSAPGTVSVTVQAIDDSGTRVIGPGSFDVISNGSSQPPLLSLPESITAEATSAAGAFVSFAVSAESFADSQPLTVTCDHTSGALYPVAITTVHCSATDAFGTTSGTFEINVSDTVGPVLNLPATIISSNPVVTYTVTATDNTDSNPTIFCLPASGSTFPVGTTTVQCTATDSHANSVHGSFKVSITGGATAPIITVPDDITAEATSGAGRAVSFSVTATDSATILCSPASGSTFPLGTTAVTCSATTAGGTSADSFNITIVDTTAPVLTLPGTINNGATSPAGAVVTFSATAADLVDGSTPVFCLPSSGSTFPIGTTVVQCGSSDSRFNSAGGSFLVIVSADVTPPVLTLPSNITAEATSASGAVVSFSATALDNVDGPVPVTCTPASGSTFALGTTTVQCSAHDAHNNTAHGSFTVTVRDTTPPTIVSVTGSWQNIWPPNHKMVNVTLTVIATDLVDPAPTSHIVSVTSNEADNANGDGDTTPDIIITGPLAVQLRAERDGGTSGTARIYTITIATSDFSGNTAHGTVTVSVSQESNAKAPESTTPGRTHAARP